MDTKHLHVVVSKEEYTIAKTRAVEKEITLSAYVESALITYRTVSDQLKEGARKAPKPKKPRSRKAFME